MIFCKGKSFIAVITSCYQCYCMYIIIYLSSDRHISYLKLHTIGSMRSWNHMNEMDTFYLLVMFKNCKTTSDIKRVDKEHIYKRLSEQDTYEIKMSSQVYILIMMTTLQNVAISRAEGLLLDRLKFLIKMTRPQSPFSFNLNVWFFIKNFYSIFSRRPWAPKITLFFSVGQKFHFILSKQEDLSIHFDLTYFSKTIFSSAISQHSLLYSWGVLLWLVNT